MESGSVAARSSSINGVSGCPCSFGNLVRAHCKSLCDSRSSTQAFGTLYLDNPSFGPLTGPNTLYPMSFNCDICPISILTKSCQGNNDVCGSSMFRLWFEGPAVLWFTFCWSSAAFSSRVRFLSIWYKPCNGSSLCFPLPFFFFVGPVSVCFPLPFFLQVGSELCSDLDMCLFVVCFPLPFFL